MKGVRSPPDDHAMVTGSEACDDVAMTGQLGADMRTEKPTRRTIFAGLIAALGSLTLFRRARAALPTARTAEGPFYPTRSMRRADIDNDLVRVAGLVRDAGGQVITLRGRILGRDGAPLPGHRIEIWQTDMNGRYLHTGDRQPVPRDAGFQGFGHDITGDDGSWRFRTIRPGKYPGRAEHIHVKVFDPAGAELLTTQFYEAGNPNNAGDFLFQRMSDDQAREVSMNYTHTGDGTEAVIDIMI